jgi:hypothetical protein
LNILCCCLSACNGYDVDSSNADNNIKIIASSEPATAADALMNSGDVWAATLEDADRDGDLIYSVGLLQETGFVAKLKFQVANAAQMSVYIQCRETPGRWTVGRTTVR